MEGIATSQATILNLLSEDQLKALREANADNSEAIQAIDSHLEAKAKAEAEAKALEDLVNALNSLELPSNVPSSVVNIYRPRIMEAIPLTKAEIAEVKASNPNISDDDLKSRRKETGNMIWGTWVLNKAFTTSKTSTSTSKTRKLAVAVHTRDGNTLSLLGNFRTSKEACDHLRLDTKGDSARRVLEAHKYVVDDYDGEDFLIKQT